MGAAGTATGNVLLAVLLARIWNIAVSVRAVVDLSGLFWFLLPRIRQLIHPSTSTL